MDTGTTSLATLPAQPAADPVQLVTQEVRNEIAASPQVYNAQQATMPQVDPSAIMQGLDTISAQGLTTLPSRDVPSNTFPQVVDEQRNPSYVPQPPVAHDYITEHQTQEDMRAVNHQQPNLVEDTISDEIKLPLLVAACYCVFQMPAVRRFMKANLKFGYNELGAPNVAGHVVTSVLFGGAVYAGLQLVEYISTK